MQTKNLSTQENQSYRQTIDHIIRLYFQLTVNYQGQNYDNLIYKSHRFMSLTSSTIGGKTKYKIVLLGDQHVGKTSVIDRFINDRFETTYSATIGIDFLVRNLSYQNKNYRLQLWDTAGQQRFKSLIPSYLKDSNICILVYDMGNSKSLQNVQKWLELYNQHKQYTAFSVLVGNKKDVSTKQCTPEMIQQTLKKIKQTNHYQISAKTGEGVSEMFYEIVDLIGIKLNSIKIIDQIEQKQEKEQKQQKNEVADSAKPSNYQNHTYVKLGIRQQNPKKNKKGCC